jgi:beta-N-acetylhexosaminidase
MVRGGGIRFRGTVVVAMLMAAGGCSASRESSPTPATELRSLPPVTVTGTTVSLTAATATTRPTTQPQSTTPATTAPAAAPPPTTTPPSTSALADPQTLAGERILCTFEGGTVPDDVLTGISDGRAAGVLLFAANLPSVDQANANATAIQAAAASSPSGAPAIVAADQEGGIVARIPGPPSASAAEMGTWPVPDIRAEARSTATNLLSWGINVDLAPVADVARSGSFEDEQRRSFSGDPEVAAAAVAAFVDGLGRGGAASTLKHFPGLGSVETTTDDAPAVVSLPDGELAAVDEVPFAAGIDAGADLVMMSSAVYSSLDDVPAVLSRAVVSGLLRRTLGFGGVVITDALDTPALAGYGSLGDLSVSAARAGVDLFIAGGTSACGEIQNALAGALLDGRLPLGPARAAAARVEALRRRLAAG